MSDKPKVLPCEARWCRDRRSMSYDRVGGATCVYGWQPSLVQVWGSRWHVDAPLPGEERAFARPGAAGSLVTSWRTKRYCRTHRIAGSYESVTPSAGPDN